MNKQRSWFAIFCRHKKKNLIQVAIPIMMGGQGDWMRYVVCKKCGFMINDETPMEVSFYELYKKFLKRRGLQNSDSLPKVTLDFVIRTAPGDELGMINGIYAFATKELLREISDAS